MFWNIFIFNIDKIFTNKMTSELITRAIYSNQKMLLNAQGKVTTGKKINKPSDDPIGAQKGAQSMSLAVFSIC